MSNLDPSVLTKNDLLASLRFGWLGGFSVAGMAEPWLARMEATLAALKEEGVGAILCVTEDAPYCHLYEKAGLAHAHVPMDDGEPTDFASLKKAVGILDSWLGQNISPAVHCLEGRGRTGMVLAAWLAKNQGLNGQKAIHTLRSLRPVTVLNPAQKAFLMEAINK
ncbi:MAG: dual specificity protein phosphatase family protein, partial [Desulfatibacillaceae bacterium]|nr:dual specificity protein phosphatase family protein [Desulfatibacillaceae bacterium]